MTLEQGVASERARAIWVKTLLVVGMAMDAIAILAGLSQRELLSRAASGVDITDAEAAANDAMYAMIGVLHPLAFLATAVCWLIWQHRAYSNLTLMGTKKTDFTPGWAIGYWFVPVISLFHPYLITKELWLRSARRNALDSIKDVAPAAVLAWWWAVYLISGHLGVALRRWSFSAETIDELQGVTTMAVALDALGILSAVLALAVVRRIDKLQQEAISSVPEYAPTDATA